jgi:hypothetical protein
LFSAFIAAALNYRAAERLPVELSELAPQSTGAPR